MYLLKLQAIRSHRIKIKMLLIVSFVFDYINQFSFYETNEIQDFIVTSSVNLF